MYETVAYVRLPRPVLPPPFPVVSGFASCLVSTSELVRYSYVASER